MSGETSHKMLMKIESKYDSLSYYYVGRPEHGNRIRNLHSNCVFYSFNERSNSNTPKVVCDIDDPKDLCKRPTLNVNNRVKNYLMGINDSYEVTSKQFMTLSSKLIGRSYDKDIFPISLLSRFASNLEQANCIVGGFDVKKIRKGEDLQEEYIGDYLLEHIPMGPIAHIVPVYTQDSDFDKLLVKPLDKVYDKELFSKFLSRNTLNYY